MPEASHPLYSSQNEQVLGGLSSSQNEQALGAQLFVEVSYKNLSFKDDSMR